MDRRVTLVLSLLMLVGVFSPLAPRAAAQDPGCAGVADWYAALPDPLREPGVGVAFENLFVTADDWAAAGEEVARLADRIARAETLAAAEDAQQALVAGYRATAAYYDGFATIIATTPYGYLYSFDAVAEMSEVLSEGRHQLLEGYRLATDLTVRCGLAPNVPTGGEGDCVGVGAWMGPANEVMKGWWSYWQQWYEQWHKEQDNPTGNIGALMGPWEQTSGFAFVEALTLATSPAPAGAAELNATLIAQLQTYSDLFLLGLLALWNQFLQADQALAQQIAADYDERVTAATAAYQDAQGDWARLADRCGVDVWLVDLPPPNQADG